MNAATQSIRFWIIAAILFMASGTVIELLLLSHYEDTWQLLPIILIGLSLICFLMTFWLRQNWVVQLLKLLLLGCVISGGLGVYFHLKANMEFEAEMHPTQSWSTTFLESLSGALPALAPGSMILFAIIGYIYILTINKLL